MHDLSIRATIILTVWFSALLYGMLIIVAVFYIRVAFVQGMKRRTDWIMYGLVVVQLLTAGAHNGLILQQILYGFEVAPIPEAYFADQGSTTHVAQTALWLTNNLIADSVLVWRLWIVYNKNKLVFIPYGILVAGSFVATVGLLHRLAAGDNLAELFDKSLAGWSETCWALSIMTQLSASVLIAYKIWALQRNVVLVRSASRYMPIVWIVLESGAILSFTTIILLAFYVKHMIAGGLLAGLCGQLAALIPSSILLRVALSRVSFHPRADSTKCALVDISQQRSDIENTAHTTMASDRTVVHVRQSIDTRDDLELYRISKEVARTDVFKPMYPCAI